MYGCQEVTIAAIPQPQSQDTAVEELPLNKRIITEVDGRSTTLVPVIELVL